MATYLAYVAGSFFLTYVYVFPLSLSPSLSVVNSIDQRLMRVEGSVDVATQVRGGGGGGKLEGKEVDSEENVMVGGDTI